MANNSNPSEMIFHDPVLYQWFFFRRSDVENSVEDQTKALTQGSFTKKFWDVVKKGGTWAKATTPIAESAPFEEIEKRYSCRLIANDGDWQAVTKEDGVERFYELDARAFLDAFWLHFACAIITWNQTLFG